MFKIVKLLCLAVSLLVLEGFAQSNNSGVLLYSQTDLGGGYPVFSNHFGVNYENLNQQAADDFIVDTEWIIDQIVVTGRYEDDNIYAEGFNIYIYSDDNNNPGYLVYYVDNQNYTQSGPSENILFTVDLQNPIVLTSGHYWLSVQAQMNWNTMPWEFWYWNQISGSYTYIAKYQNPGGIWPQGCLSWDIIPDCFQGYTTQTDLYFELYGELLTSVESTALTPSTHSLIQNYPNPFNPNTVISYQLPVGSDITLKVYDVLGDEVATLVDEYKPAGSYEVEFDAKNLTSGIYLYKLQVGNNTETKKMVLMK